MRRWIPWALIVFNVAGTIVLGAKAQDLIKLDTWQIVAAMAASVSKPIGDRLIFWLDDGRESSKLKKRRAIEGVVKGGLVDILKRQEPKLHWSTVGISVFVVRKPVLWLFGEEHLRRVAREKMSVSHPSGVKWTKGKGVIGACWARSEDTGRDFAHDYAKLNNCSRDRWDALPDPFRQGLTYDDFEKTRNHGAVVATPILDDDDRFLGCVSIDAPGDAYDILWSEDVRRSLQLTARSVKPYL